MTEYRLTRATHGVRPADEFVCCEIKYNGTPSSLSSVPRVMASHGLTPFYFTMAWATAMDGHASTARSGPAVSCEQNGGPVGKYFRNRCVLAVA